MNRQHLRHQPLRRCRRAHIFNASHYHFPPSCLETQIGSLTDGHSPQVGWALDGFPIYGGKGPGGITMTHTNQGCTGDYCLGLLVMAILAGVGSLLLGPILWIQKKAERKHLA